MQYFVVRHIDTGHALPAGIRGSLWDPEDEPTGLPRLFRSSRAARNFINAWARGKGFRQYPFDYRGRYIGGPVTYQPTTRDKQTLEIVPVSLTYGDPL